MALFSSDCKIWQNDVEIDFYQHISEELGRLKVCDSNDIPYGTDNRFTGSFSDYIALADSRSISRFSLLRLLIEKKSDIEHTVTNVSVPLSYLGLIKFSGGTLSTPDLLNEYKKYYDQLADVDKQFFKQRDEIAIFHQSPNAKRQAVVEAVANGIDALREMSIGEKGLGIKQALAYLEGDGEIKVTTKTANGPLYTMHNVRAVDGEYHQRINEVKGLDDALPSGTELCITLAKPLADTEISDLIETIARRFRPAHSVAVYVNKTLINDFAGVTDANGDVISVPENIGRVDVEIHKDEIVVRDTGRGMEIGTLATMFVSRAGTKHLEIQPNVTQQERAVTFFGDKSVDGTVIISRRGEALEVASIASGGRLGLCEDEIIIEAAGLRVPEARQSVFIDQSFFSILQVAAERVLSGKRSVADKLRFLNSVCAYADELQARKGAHAEGGLEEVGGYVYDLKRSLRNSAKGIVEAVRNSHVLLPNNSLFASFTNEESIFLAGELFDFVPEQVPGITKVSLFTQRAVYAFPSVMCVADMPSVFAYEDSLFIRQDLVEAYEVTEAGSAERAYLHELIELAVNPVDTSYNPHGKSREVLLTLRNTCDGLARSEAGVTWEGTPATGVLRDQFAYAPVRHMSGRNPTVFPFLGGFIVARSEIPGACMTYFDASLNEQTLPVEKEGADDGYYPLVLEDGVSCLHMVDRVLFCTGDGQVSYTHTRAEARYCEHVRACCTSDGYAVAEILSDGACVFTCLDKQFQVTKRGTFPCWVDSSAWVRSFLQLGDGTYVLVHSATDNARTEKTVLRVSEQGLVETLNRVSSSTVFDVCVADDTIFLITESGLCWFSAQSGEFLGEVVHTNDQGVLCSKAMSTGDVLVCREHALMVLSRRDGYAVPRNIFFPPHNLKNALVSLTVNASETQCLLCLYGDAVYAVDLGTGGVDDLSAVSELRYSSACAFPDDSFITVSDVWSNGKGGSAIGRIEKVSFSPAVRDKGADITFDNHVSGAFTHLKSLCSVAIEDEPGTYARYTDAVRRVVSMLTTGGGIDAFTLENVFPLSEASVVSLSQHVVVARARRAAMSKEYQAHALSPDLFLGETGKLLAAFIADQDQHKLDFVSRLLDGVDDPIPLFAVLEDVYDGYRVFSSRTDRDQALFFGTLGMFAQSVSQEPDRLIGLAAKLSRIARHAVYETFRAYMEGTYDDHPVISYLGKKKEETMPAKPFLEYLESKSVLDIREGEPFVPDDAIDVLPWGEVPGIALYYHGRKGKIADSDLADSLERFVQDHREIPAATQELLREQIKKEIYGQAAEGGVRVREMLQNMIDAARRANLLYPEGAREQSVLEIDCFEETYTADDGQVGRYLVETYRDYGSGIPGLVDLLVAQINSKSGVDTAGFFGSGFLSMFEDADVLTIKTSDGGGQARYIEICTTRDEAGVVCDFSVKRYKRRAEDFRGTVTARKKRLRPDDIPEMEYAKTRAALIKNTMLLDACLPNGEQMSVVFEGKTQEHATTPLYETTFSVGGVPYSVKLYEGKYSQVASGYGLRMSDLESKYTALVPHQVRGLVSEKNLSLVIDGNIKLIKDRSAMADESSYLPGLQCAVGTAVIKLAIKELFKTGRKFEGWPDDYLSNLKYAYAYDSEEGQRIANIATRLNLNEELSVQDLKFLSVEGNDLTSRLARLAVLTNIEYYDTDKDDELIITSLAAKRAQMMAQAQAHLNQSEIAPLLEKECHMLELYGVNTQEIKNVISAIDQPVEMTAGIISMKLNAPKVVPLEDTSISENERENFMTLVHFIKSVYGNNVQVYIDSETIRDGLSRGNEIYVSRELLQQPKQLLETAVHELAHFQEGTGGHDRNFTHQANGSFGHEYKDVVHKLLREFMKINKDMEVNGLPLVA